MGFDQTLAGNISAGRAKQGCFHEPCKEALGYRFFSDRCSQRAGTPVSKAAGLHS